MTGLWGSRIALNKREFAAIGSDEWRCLLDLYNLPIVYLGSVFSKIWVKEADILHQKP